MSSSDVVAAIKDGDLDALSSALEAASSAAAAANAEDPETWLSPLHHAAMCGQVEATKLLLASGADPNAEARPACTLLRQLPA